MVDEVAVPRAAYERSIRAWNMLSELSAHAEKVVQLHANGFLSPTPHDSIAIQKLRQLAAQADKLMAEDGAYW